MSLPLWKFIKLGAKLKNLFLPRITGKAITRRALDIRDYVAKHEFHGQRLQFRIGINSGSVVAGVIARKKFALIKNDFRCESCGRVNAKGKGKIHVWYILDKLV